MTIEEINEQLQEMKRDLDLLREQQVELTVNHSTAITRHLNEVDGKLSVLEARILFLEGRKNDENKR